MTIARKMTGVSRSVRILLNKEKKTPSGEIFKLVWPGMKEGFCQPAARTICEQSDMPIVLLPRSQERCTPLLPYKRHRH